MMPLHHPCPFTHHSIATPPHFFHVKKHNSFFHVVSTYGQAEDFSYIKVLDNFIKGKYPSLTKAFNSQVFLKASGRRESTTRET
ncbi:hypothetical protein vseg_000901 [Gypsophila vaccaria]